MHQQCKVYHQRPQQESFEYSNTGYYTWPYLQLPPPPEAQLPPLAGNCLAKNIIYKATVKPQSSSPKQYIGLTSTTFKERIYNHHQDFKNDSKHSTELSNFIWKLKRRNEPFDIEWSIVQRANSYNPATKRCNLCIAEKFHIMRAPRLSSLNKRSELYCMCIHKKKFKLDDFDVT